MLIAWVALARRRSGAEDLLALQTRRHIYERLQEYPGLHLSELARTLDLEPNHVKYHLLYLERHGLAVGRKEDGYWRFWPKDPGAYGDRDRIPSADKQILSMLRRPIPLHITVLLLEADEATATELASQVPVSRSTLHYHITKLERAGIIGGRRDGRERILFVEAPDHIRNLLIERRPPPSLVAGFLQAWEDVELRGSSGLGKRHRRGAPQRTEHEGQTGDGTADADDGDPEHGQDGADDADPRG